MKYYWVFCIFLKENSGYNIRMWEITTDNCYKCDLETINDPNDSQYFWINRTDLEIETKRNWQVIKTWWKVLISIKTHWHKDIEKN